MRRKEKSIWKGLHNELSLGMSAPRSTFEKVTAADVIQRKRAMSDYMFYKVANQSLDEIWQYSLNEWNEKQVDDYISGLFDKIQEAASKEV